MDLRYTDFDEVEFLSIASYNIVEKERKVWLTLSRLIQQFKARSVLGWGKGTNFAIY